MPEVRMTVEEYLELLERTASNVKRVGKAAKGLGRAMKEANERLRTKSGKLRMINGKRATQADVARLAHKIRRQKYA